MKALLSRIHAKLGDLWWYTILLFVSQRLGDVINMFVGLWIVPKYVPMDELGAVLPLTSVVSLIGIPLSIVAIPFLKFIAVFAEKKEYGRVKALIRDTFIGTGVFALLSILIAYFVLPLFFERLRVQNGSLAFLLVVVTVLTAVSCIFGNAIQALRLFTFSVWFQAISAPFRLLLVAVLMPFRPLSGYVAGGAAAPGVSIVGCFFALRKFWRSAGRPVPYWREYKSAIWQYTWPLIIMTVVSAITGNMDMLVIRHRLCDFESAGYYMVTRFSDVSVQLGSAFVAFLMPLLAARDGNDAEARKMTFHSVAGVMSAGLLLSALLAAFGRQLLCLRNDWAAYASLTPHMVAMAFNGAVGMACTCISTAFTARGRFLFLWYYLGIGIVKSALLYAVTGYTFFAGWMPDAWMDALAAFNPNRLSVVIWVMSVANVFTFILLCAEAFVSKRTHQEG